MDTQELVEQADTLAGTVQDFVTLEDGTKVQVFRCKVKQIGPVLSLIGRLMKDLGVVNIDDDKQMSSLESRLSNPTNLLQLIATYSVEIPSMVSMLTSLTEDEAEEMELEDALTVITKMWEVNESFFSKKILPMLVRAR